MPKEIEIIARPFDWPGKPTPASERRHHNPFRSSLEKSLRKLKAELRHLDASTVVLATGHEERDISTVSGLPRGDKTPRHPGVMVAADTKFGSLKWMTDVFWSWPVNLHAIALTLERLRLADLYGVTKRGEQYTGWKMLPGPITGGQGAALMNIEDAAKFVSDTIAAAGPGPATHVTPARLIRDKSAWTTAYRLAAARLHPDVAHDEARWKQLQDAAQLLNNLHDRK